MIYYSQKSSTGARLRIITEVEVLITHGTDGDYADVVGTFLGNDGKYSVLLKTVCQVSDAFRYYDNLIASLTANETVVLCSR